MDNQEIDGQEKSDAEKNDAEKGEAMLAHFRWVSERLKQDGKVTREDFRKYYDDYHKTRGGKYDLYNDWHRVSVGVEALFPTFGIEVKREPGKKGGLVCLSPVPGASSPGALFNPHKEKGAKTTIGQLVAKWLHEQNKENKDRVIVLTSGSTVWHVGLQMCEFTKAHGPYLQNIWTTNVPLAAEWCRSAPRPCKEVHIPEAVLELEQSRFSRMEEPKYNWTFSIAVIGAHGCLLDTEGNAGLYAGWDSTAVGNQWFINRALYAVVACLPSTRLEISDNEKGVAGPRITPPASPEVRKYLVTDDLPRNKLKINSLKRAGWWIVTKDEDWRKQKEWEEKSGTAHEGGAPVETS